MKDKPYYIIVGRDKKSIWYTAWGAYTRKECQDEMPAQKGCYKYRKIIKAKSDKQSDIDIAVRELNKEYLEQL